MLKLSLVQKYFGAKMAEGESAEKHLLNMSELCDRLAAVEFVKVILTCCDSAYPFTAVVPYPVMYMYIYLPCVAVMLDRWSNSPVTVSNGLPQRVYQSTAVHQWWLP